MFLHYTGGILNNSCCLDLDNGALDHSVLTVGWGVTAGQAYWIIRNSWGTDWGENGFARITATKTGFGICGNQFENYSINMLKL